MDKQKDGKQSGDQARSKDSEMRIADIQNENQ